MAKKIPDPITCVCCKCPLGDEARVIPTFVETDGEPRGAWCPQDFVHVRAAKEPERFHQAGYAAISCAHCGKQSVGAGRTSCGQCGSRSTIVLGPKIAVA